MLVSFGIFSDEIVSFSSKSETWFWSIHLSHDRKILQTQKRNLQTHFFPSFYRVQYHLTTACVGKILYECVGNSLPESSTSSILDLLINEKSLCEDGPLTTLGNPKLSHPNVTLTCNSTYDQKAALCGKTVRDKFVANPSDSSLCRFDSRLYLIVIGSRLQQTRLQPVLVPNFS